jgi:MoaA/NifB/PqqE/SkfB family radical SAM enzyme
MKKSEIAKNSKTFCILPWIHQYVGPPGDIKPCCMYDQNSQIGDLKNSTLEDIWNNEQTRKLRIDMLEGKTIPECHKCNTRENLTITHRAQFNNFKFKGENIAVVDSTLDDGTVPEHKLKYIDVRFNNLCNLKCRTCGPRFSTSWIEDHVRMYDVKAEDRQRHGDIFQYPGQTEEQLLEEIMPHLPYVQEIYFAGGEPLMQKEHYAVLDELIRLGRTGNDLSINYNTNFSTLKLGSKNVLDLWKQFRFIRISASLDGSGTRAEYWRKGTVWDTILKNRKLLKEECPNVNFSINYTLSWINAFNLVEMHKEWTELELCNINDINVNLLDTPNYYSLKAIPWFKKQKIEKVILEHIKWLQTKGANDRTINGFRNAITFMHDSEPAEGFSLSKDFLKVSNTLDEIRGEDFWTTFPEHQDMKIFLNIGEIAKHE